MIGRTLRVALLGALLVVCGHGGAEAQARAKDSREAFKSAVGWFAGLVDPIRNQADANAPLEKMGYSQATPMEWAYEDADGHVSVYVFAEVKRVFVVYLPTNKKPMNTTVLSAMSQAAESIDMNGADEFTYSMKPRTWPATVMKDEIVVRMSDGAWLETSCNITWKSK